VNSMFRSARFKLTLFYLAAVLTVSLTMSIGTRWLAQREYEHSNNVARGTLNSIIRRLYGVPDMRRDIYSFQDVQEERVRQRLNEYVLMINLAAFVIGGFGSWWFAGRTLRPIEEAHEAQKRFASDASHELRTPLTAIKTENEVFLRQKDFSQQEARELIQSNLEEVERLERLATSLLQLTQFESTKLTLKAVDVKAIAAAAVKQTQKTHPTVQLTQNMAAGKVVAHKESMTQLLAILLDNAYKYSPAGKPVMIWGESRDGHYAIEVQDQGPGIAPKDLPYIFDRLYRGDKARSSSVPGHGLGLALAKQIAIANQAELSATTGKHGGARFTVVLPGVQRGRSTDPK
jgi:signal transduction histidine kinase